MLRILKRLYNKLFKPTQLIIRQDAKMKVLRVPAWLQASTLMVLLLVATWLLNNTVALYKNNQLLASQQQTQATREAKWQAEKQQLEQQLLEQHATLQKLAQQHQVLASLLDTSDEPTSVTDSNTETLAATQNIDFSPAAEKLLQQQQSASEAISSQLAEDITAIEQAAEEAGVELSEPKQVAQGGPYHQAELNLVDDSFITAIDQQSTYAQLSALVSQLPSSLPVVQDKYYVSSLYGYRKDPITGRRAYHKGIDMAGWVKTEIIAPAAGEVVRAGRNGGYGNFIELKHGNNIKTRYGHLHTLKVKKGQTVDKGDVIALMGSTGRSTATHLHYEVIQGKKHLNPIKITRAFNQ